MRSLDHELAVIFKTDVWDIYQDMKTRAVFKTEEDSASAEVQKTLKVLTVIKPQDDDRDQIRALWAQTFGFDVWYPYYKSKEVEAWAKEKVSFKVFKMKCTPKFEKKSFVYICKKRF